MSQNRIIIKEGEEFVENNRKYKILQEIGRSPFGAVVQILVDGEVHAAKFIQLDLIKKQSEKEKIIQGIEMLKELDHPYIMKFYTSFTRTWACQSFPGRPPIMREYLIMDLEYCPSSLQAILPNVEEELTDEQQQQNDQRFSLLLHQTIIALDYIHKKGILHRDIKPANILISSNVVKLCDFEFARKTEVASTFGGTAPYMPPEMFESDKYTNKCDVWSFAVMAFYIYSGEHPFGTDIHNVRENTKWLSFDMELIKNCPYKQLILDFLVVDPLLRPSFDEYIQKHPEIAANNLISLKFSSLIAQDLSEQVKQQETQQEEQFNNEAKKYQKQIDLLVRELSLDKVVVTQAVVDANGEVNRARELLAK